MKISYAPAAQHGVTHLVAVGDDGTDAATTTLEAKVSGAGILAMIVGAVAGSRRAFWAGAGVAGGILLVRHLRAKRTVLVTTP